MPAPGRPVRGCDGWAPHPPRSGVGVGHAVVAVRVSAPIAMGGKSPQHLDAGGVGEHPEHLDDQWGLIGGQPRPELPIICIHAQTVAL